MTRRLLSTLPATLLLAAGCTAELVGPAPEVLGVSPALTCNDQLITEVIVHGSALAPMVASGLDTPELVLPAVELTRVGDLTGLDDGANGAPVRVEQVSVRWTDAETLAFDVSAELGLADGLYDVTVEAPDGQRATATGVLVAVDAPTLTDVEPALVCVAQYDNALTLTGTGFLDVAGTLPGVAIGTASLTAAARDGCGDLAGPTAGRSCTCAGVTLPQSSLADGVHGVVLTNPEPAQCATVESVVIEAVPPPAIADLEPGLECVAQEAQSVLVTGAGFLVVEGVLPTVQAGDWTGGADTVDGCTDTCRAAAARAAPA